MPGSRLASQYKEEHGEASHEIATTKGWMKRRAPCKVRDTVITSVRVFVLLGNRKGMSKDKWLQGQVHPSKRGHWTIRTAVLPL